MKSLKTTLTSKHAVSRWISLGVYVAIILGLYYFAPNVPMWLAIIAAIIVSFVVRSRWEKSEPTESAEVAILHRCVNEARQMVLHEGYDERLALYYLRGQLISNGFDSAYTDRLIDNMKKLPWVRGVEFE